MTKETNVEFLDKLEKESTPDLTSGDLSNISEMGRQLTKLEEEIDSQEKYLKSLKENFRKLSEDLLPNRLRELGISEFKLSDGTSISIQQYYSARITPENRDVCFHWLETNGLGDIIKNTVSAKFG